MLSHVKKTLMSPLENTVSYLLLIFPSSTQHNFICFLFTLSEPTVLIELLAINVIKIYWQCSCLLKPHCSECLLCSTIEYCHGSVRQLIPHSIISMAKLLPRVPLGVWMLCSDKSFSKQNTWVPLLVGKGNEICISTLLKMNVIGLTTSLDKMTHAKS